MDYYQILGANIRALRVGKELTQEKLAELSNLHRTYIGAIERGDRNISFASANDCSLCPLVKRAQRPRFWRWIVRAFCGMIPMIVCRCIITW